MKNVTLMICFAITLSLSTVACPTIKQSYDRQIGVREKTGNNDGVKVEMYLRTVNLGKGYPWCAAFVKFNLLQAGITSAYKINGMALSCESKQIVFKKVIVEPIRAGDVFTLYYPALKRIGHTGFFDKQINNQIYATVEGNTNEAGSREGDGVYRKYRSYKATHSISRWI